MDGAPHLRWRNRRFAAPASKKLISQAKIGGHEGPTAASPKHRAAAECRTPANRHWCSARSIALLATAVTCPPTLSLESVDRVPPQEGLIFDLRDWGTS